MGCINLLIHARHKHLIVFSMALAFFLMSSSTPSQFLAQGRQLFPPNSEMGEKIIGSRPPKCENRCRSCGHCEAVQVPIIPAAAAIKFLNSGNSGKKKKKKNPRNSIQYSRGDDVSSYKPMCWKCKCGNLFFNP